MVQGKTYEATEFAVAAVNPATGRKEELSATVADGCIMSITDFSDGTPCRIWDICAGPLDRMAEALAVLMEEVAGAKEARRLVERRPA